MRNSKYGSHRREYRRRVEDQEVNNYDNVVILSADIEGRDNEPRTTEEALDCQKWAKGGVGKSTNLEKERFALVDDEGNDEELFGRADRRCEIGGVGSEEPETFLILLGRRRQRKRGGRS